MSCNTSNTSCGCGSSTTEGCDCFGNGVVIPKGDTGSNGLSAYEIWLEVNGYSASDYSYADFITAITGQNGSQGEYGGYASNWVFNASTSSGTSATQLRFDNSAMASVTKIWLNDTNADNTDLSAFVASFSNGGEYGNIRVFKESDSNVFAMFTMSGRIDSGSENQLAVTYVTHNGTFAQGDSLVVEFAPSGSTGAVGPSGGLQYETLIELTSTGNFAGTETLIPGATYTFPSTGTYQIHITSSLYLRPGTPSADTIMNWYLDAVEKQTKTIIKSTAGANIGNVFPGFVWRGSVTAGQVLEVRGVLGTGSTECSVDKMEILVNKEA